MSGTKPKQKLSLCFSELLTFNIIKKNIITIRHFHVENIDKQQEEKDNHLQS